ncbi:MAG: hypothetical protein U0O29_05965 [Oscillospiraceae bacterium]
MKKKLPYALAGLMLLCLLCTACGGDSSLQDDVSAGSAQPIWVGKKHPI